MLVRRVVRRCRLLTAFLRDRRANVAVTFTLATIPIVGFVGSAVDYSHANSLKAKMQSAIDATALMMSKTAATQTQAQLQAAANNYFKALFTRPEAQNVQVNVTYTSASGSEIIATATATMATDFMGIMGYPNLNISVSSTVNWGNKRLRVALALDNTGSMASAGKMTALKTATKNLLTQLQNVASRNGDIYVSIIPFSKDVNVGAASYQANWVRWDLWDAANGTCSDNDYHSRNSCLNHNKTWTPRNHNTWNGCITDRDQDYDILNTSPSPSIVATQFVAEQYDGCPAEMIGLTNKWTDLINLVGLMTPNGFTNQQIGLAWAWMALTNGEPLNAPVKGPDMQQVIILLSDGMNTQNRFSSTQADIDARQAKLCENIKKAGIIIYAVQVNTGSDPLSTVMKGCATDASKFFLLTTASQIIATFSEIGTKISKLRIAS